MRLTMTNALIALLALAAGLGLAACGDDGGDGGGAYGGSKTSTSAPRTSTEGTGATTRDKPAVKTIAVHDGKPVGGVAELEYSAGDEVRFRVRSDVADEVHVHGYDLIEAVAAGGTVPFAFPANIEGIFEVELEEHEEQIAELRVNP